LDELDISVIVEHIDPHPEMKDVAMRVTQKRYVIFISCGQRWISQRRWVFMYAFLTKGNPYHFVWADILFNNHKS
jgi:hypothetical protein